MEENQELLLNQIIDLHGKVVYTYTTHHKIQNRLERINKGVKISQIILTAVSMFEAAGNQFVTYFDPLEE